MKNDMILSVLICDDEKYFFKTLKEYLCRNVLFRDSVFMYSKSREEMLKMYRKMKPDIVFMDIEVGEDIGFDIIRELLDEG